MHELVVFSGLTYNWLHSYEIRQNKPVSFSRIFPALSRKNSSYKKGIDISPDNTKMIVAYQYNTSNTTKFWVSETDNLTTTQSLTYFEGIINCVAISNTHYAVAGSSPFLNVYKWDSHQIIAIDKQGLGAVNDVCFNHNGTKLFVYHQNAPHLRVYDTTDWTHKDVATNKVVSSSSASMYYVQNRLVFFGATTTHNSHFKTFDDELTELFAYPNSSQWSNFALSYNGVTKCVVDEAGLLVIRHNASNRLELFRLNIDTGEISHKISVNGYSVSSVVLIGQLLYVSHNTYENRTISVFSAEDLSFNEQMTKTFSLLQGEVVDFAIIKKDTGKITGQVRDVNNSPASRTVRAFDRKTGKIVAQTVSDTTGNYQLNLPTTDDVDVQFMAQDGENLPDLFYAKVTPELVP